MTRKILLLIGICFMGMSQLLAQPKESLIMVNVAPQNADWIYKKGENVSFTVSVLKHGVPMEGAKIRCELSEDMMPPLKVLELTLNKGTATINGGTMKKAGFLRCRVFAQYDGQNYEGVATAGFDPQTIESTTVLPDDFKAFWDNEKDKAKAIPMDARMTLMPEKCTANANVYHVSLQNYQSGCRLYGILCVPKAEGKYPAILNVPGAGVGAQNGDIGSAENGIITFAIGIHGIPVNMPENVYNDLGRGALSDYPYSKLDDRDNYYYKRVYLGCVRAIDFLSSLEQFNGKNLFVSGGSQGGALAIVTASLDQRVTGLVSYYPALCELTGFVHGRAGGWPHLFSDRNDTARNTEARMRTTQYYDVVNFARFITVPGFYTFGFNDMVCPPTSMFSAYNVIKAPKTLELFPQTAHYTYPEQGVKSWSWVHEQLKK